MTTVPIARILTLLGALLLVAGSTACGDDTIDIGDGVLPTDLAITYEHPDVGTREYRVVCLGDTATVTGAAEGIDEQAACEALADDAVRVRLVEGPPTDRACTEIYGGPDTATIVGTIEGGAVDTTVDRTDGCGIDEWDVLLTDLLPPARPFG